LIHSIKEAAFIRCFGLKIGANVADFYLNR